MGKIPFLKMHGLGNDFVVLDGRGTAIAIDAAGASALADRRTGIGCDQVIVLERPRHPTAQVTMRIRNPDGGEAEACGNATRCVAALLHRETGATRMRIETIAGLLDAEILPDGRSEQGQHRKTCQIGHPPAGGGPRDDRSSIVRLNGFLRAIARATRPYGFLAAGTFCGISRALDRTVRAAI